MTYLVMQMLLCLFIAFVLGLLLGWWLGRRKLEQRVGEVEQGWRGRLDRCREELEAGRTEAARPSEASGAREEALTQSRADLAECRRELASGEEALAKCRADLAECRSKPTRTDTAGSSDAEPAAAMAAIADTAPLEEPAASDDLTRIEGIGPKIAGLLKDRGITTWNRLAETDVAVLQSVLDDAGPRYRIHDPSTWPQQAALAAAGSWDELEALQDHLKGGRNVEPDDLKVVEGIGPKIEGLLNADGISTWARLARTEVSFLQSVLDKAGPRYRIHDPGTWPRQAALATSGMWTELEALQDRLKGGRER